MEFRTTFNIKPSGLKIDYNTPVMFIGSCFSSEIGAKMEEARMPVLINPAGTVYNPGSVKETLENIIHRREFTKADLYNYNNLWVSFSHYSTYSAEDPDYALQKINSSTRIAHDFLKKAGFLFITFGTARVYIFSETGKLVSNCHKIPSSLFKNELLDPEAIEVMWTSILAELLRFNSNIKVIFTVSPVRHLKDGAHENQVSKSVLFLAIEKLLSHKAVAGYFPAYELVMDDLRDYRFYSNDMLHPSAEAIYYVWKAFCACYFSPSAVEACKEIAGITKAMNHKFLSDSIKGRMDFSRAMLDKISAIEKKFPETDLSVEKNYFRNIMQ
jgi:hypothetical protein